MERQHDNPAHRHVAYHAHDSEFLQADCVEHGVEDGQAPDNAEKRPAYPAVQAHQRKGRVGPRNQKKDGDMVKHAQHPLGGRMGNRVIERAHHIQHKQRNAENGGGHDAPRVARIRRAHQHQNQSDNGKPRAYPVRYGVEYLFPRSLQAQGTIHSAKHSLPPFPDDVSIAPSRRARKAETEEGMRPPRPDAIRMQPPLRFCAGYGIIAARSVIEHGPKRARAENA